MKNKFIRKWLVILTVAAMMIPAGIPANAETVEEGENIAPTAGISAETPNVTAETQKEEISAEMPDMTAETQNEEKSDVQAEGQNQAKQGVLEAVRQNTEKAEEASDAVDVQAEERTAGEVQIGEQIYPTLTEAFAAAKDGDVLRLLENAEVSQPILLTKNVTLDTNGFTVSAAAGFKGNFMFTNRGTFNIVGSGIKLLYRVLGVGPVLTAGKGGKAPRIVRRPPFQVVHRAGVVVAPHGGGKGPQRQGQHQQHHTHAVDQPAPADAPDFHFISHNDLFRHLSASPPRSWALILPRTPPASAAPLIPIAPHRIHIRRLRGVVLNLDAQAADVHVHDLQLAKIILTPHRVQDLLPGEGFPRVLHKQLDDPILHLGELHPLAVFLQSPLAGVEHKGRQRRH